MNRILLKGGRIIDPTLHIDQMGDLLIVEDLIHAVGDGLTDEKALVVDCQGKIIAPGFIDAHVHLREPGLEYMGISWSIFGITILSSGVEIGLSMSVTTGCGCTFCES